MISYFARLCAFVSPCLCTGLSAQVLVEPIDGACPCLLGRCFVVALRRGVVVEAMNGTGIDVSLMWNVGRFQSCLVRRPALSQPCIHFAMMNQHCRFDLRNVGSSGRPSVK